MNQSSNIILFFAAIFVFAALLLLVITVTKRSGKNYDIEKYRSRWLSIERSLKSNEPASHHMAILNADKLVDLALREGGFKGDTMAYRLKAARPKFQDAASVWRAHKLRNVVAHETESTITYSQARTALAGFKSALKDLGAI